MRKLLGSKECTPAADFCPPPRSPFSGSITGKDAMNGSLSPSLHQLRGALPRLVCFMACGVTLAAIGNFAAQTAQSQSPIKMTVNTLGAETTTEHPQAVVAPSFALTSSPSTLTVSYGQSGNETLTITPAGNYLGIVELSASVPALVNTNASGCLSGSGLVGNTVSVSATTSVTLTLYTVPTNCPVTVGTLGNRPGTGKQFPENHSLPARASLAIGGLFLAGFVGRRARKLRGFAAIIVLATLGFTLSGCGGSSPSNNLPRGTYPITITGTDSLNAALTSSTNFTLVVQ